MNTDLGPKRQMYIKIPNSHFNNTFSTKNLGGNNTRINVIKNRRLKDCRNDYYLRGMDRQTPAASTYCITCINARVFMNVFIVVVQIVSVLLFLLPTTMNAILVHTKTYFKKG